MELYGVMAEAAHATASLKEWMAPAEVASPPPAHASVSKIYRDPLGTVLIIGAWNYPASPLPNLAARQCGFGWSD